MADLPPTVGSRCGTPSGATRHANLGEKACDACALAKKKYDEEYRAAPDRVRRSRLSAKAQSLAHAVLRERHYDEYREAYEKFKAELFAENGLK